MISFVLGDFMKNKRKICAALMLISFMFQNAIVKGADDEILTGTCNSGSTTLCEWTLNKTSGTIVLENPGDFIAEKIQIDSAQRKFVKEGVIANGIQKIYNYPFYGMSNLKNVSLPDTITEIGNFMYNCPQVEELTFSGDFSIVEACSRCDGLKIINLGRSVYPKFYTGGYNAIARYCPNLISVNVDEGNESLKSVKGALLTKDGKELNVFPFGRTSKAVIPYGVEKTSGSTFYDCPLTSVTIPETVKTIHDAFKNSNNLSTINFFGTQEPATSFDFCGSEVINVPHDYNGTTFWGYPVQKVIDHHGYLNDNCTCWMTQDEDVQMTIGGDGAIDSSLLADDGSTWKDVKDKIKKVNIDEGITTVDMSMFSDFENLSEVSLPKSVKNVASLSECSSLVSINVPEDNETYSTVDGVLFSKDCKKLIYYPAGKSNSSYNIPASTITICADAFSDCKNLQEVTLPENIVRVEDGAFSENSSLKTLNYLGKEPLSGDFSFKNPPKVLVCTDYNGDELFGIKVSKVFGTGNHDGLSWVFDPEYTLTVKWNGIIERNPHLDKFKKLAKRLVVEDGVTSIDFAAFYGYDFTDVTLPDTLETIRHGAFGLCRQLTDVVLPSGVKSIDIEAFKGCHDLRSVTLNEGLEEIGRRAFEDCKRLVSITLPKSLKAMGDYVFSGCTSLDSITLPKSLRTLGVYAFNGCYGLTEIRVEDGSDFYCDIDGVLFSKPGLTLVHFPNRKGGNYTVPENVTAIDAYAFCNAEVESVTIQGPLDSIGEGAFYGCRNLKSVYMDGEVERVDDHAFAFCKSLSEVEYEGEPKLGKDVFIGCDKLNTTTT